MPKDVNTPNISGVNASLSSVSNIPTDGPLFRYKRLDAEDAIRLLFVYPKTDDSEISCDIHYSTLRSQMKYIAVSYAPKNPARTVPMRINGRLFLICDEVAGFLEHVRENYSSYGKYFDGMNPLLFWIDEICVNHDNLFERKHKVLTRPEVFKNATGVIAWLGQTTATSDRAIPKLLELQRWLETESQKVNSNPPTADNNQSVIESKTVLGTEVADNTTDPPDYDSWMALDAFLSRPYWRKISTVPEVMAKPSTLFVCGRFYLSWSLILQAQIAISHISNQRGFEKLASLRHLLEPGERWALRMYYDRGGKDMELILIMQRYRELEAMDPRDHVYAALSYAVDYEAGELQIDYEISVPEVYINFVRWFINKKSTLDWLGYTGYVNAPMADLPSWAPDWSRELLRVPLCREFIVEGSKSRPVYNPCGPISGGTESPLSNRPLSASICGRNLTLKGLYVDRIASLCDVVKTDSLVDFNVEKSWIPEDQNKLYTPTGERMLEVYFRTILVDTLSTDMKPTSRASSITVPASLPLEADLLAAVASISPNGGVQEAATVLKSVTFRRRWVTTERGYVGLVPAPTKVGDEVWVLIGGQVLYVLSDPKWKSRRDSSEVEYYFIGECYLHGLMDGEAMDGVSADASSLQKVVLR